jgi:hypothetical protein
MKMIGKHFIAGDTGEVGRFNIVLIIKSAAIRSRHALLCPFRGTGQPFRDNRADCWRPNLGALSRQ